MNTKRKDLDNPLKISIHSIQDYKLWLKSIRRFTLDNRVKTYHFSIPEFTDVTNSHISDTVSKLDNACGCKFGSFTMSLTFLGIVINYLSNGNSLLSIGLTEIGFCIGYTLLGALIGKCIGLIYAKYQLINYTDKILSQLTSIPSTNNQLFTFKN